MSTLKNNASSMGGLVLLLICIAMACYFFKEGVTGGFYFKVGYFASLVPGLLFLVTGVVVFWIGRRNS